MELLKMPIVEYYKNCLNAAKQQGYKWVISLIARPGDVDGLYEDLREFWSSLDSITGRYFFICCSWRRR